MSDEIDDGTIEIHGKQYLTVARRLKDFRNDHPDWSIRTNLLEASELVRVKALIKDSEGRTISTGYSEELRGGSNINKTSVVENAETSAVGRALAFLGYTGTAIASAEEMEKALEQQKELQGLEYLKAHNAAVRDNFESLYAIKGSLANSDYSTAYEAWAELDQDTQKSLWVAPTNGGILTTAERGEMKSNEWNDARKAHHNIEDE